MRIAAPLNTPVFGHVNGDHPLLAQLIEHTPGFEFLPAAEGDPTLGGFAAALDDAAALGRRLTDPRPGEPICDPAAVGRFLASRDVGSQALVPDADLTFLHTVPLTFDAAPWVLHLESATTLFWPFLHQGALRDRRLRDEPIHPIIARLLASDHCRGLFTHCRHTVEQIGRMFPDDRVAAKLRYAPLGVRVDERWEAEVDAAMEARSRPGRPMEILFTNSWHQAPENFRNRGGLDVVAAFVELHRRRPDVHLTVRSSLPDEVEAGEVGRILREHPAITVIDHKISDDALHRLILAADVFALPSAALHSVSVLRAMTLGAVCVVSDLPLFAEFIDDGENGVVVRGRAAKVLSADPESGWEQDDYATMRDVDPTVSAGLVEAFMTLHDEPERRRSIAEAARRTVARRFAFEPFRDAFAELLRSAMPDTGSAPRERTAWAAALAGHMEREFSIRRHPLAEEPIMTESHRGFDIVWHRGTVFAIRQGQGDVDVARGAGHLRSTLEPENLAIGRSLEEVLARVDAIEAAREYRETAARLDARLDALAVDARTVDEELARRIDAMCYGPAGDPRAVHPVGTYRDFNLLCHDGRVFALRQGVDGFEPGLSEAELRQRFDADDLALAGSIDDAVNAIDLIVLRRETGERVAEIHERIDRTEERVNERIDRAEERANERIDRTEERANERIDRVDGRVDILAHGPAGDPTVLIPVGEHRGFNLLWHGGRVLAIRQTVGAIDPTEGIEALRGRLAAADLVVASDVEIAKCRIDLIEMERNGLAGRLRRGAGRVAGAIKS